MKPLNDWHAGKAVRLMRRRSRYWALKDALRFLWPMLIMALALYWVAPLDWF